MPIKNPRIIQNSLSKVRSVFSLGSLIAIFLIVLLVNQNSVSNKTEYQLEAEGPREIASAHPLESKPLDSSWKKKLASQISEVSHLPSAKSARQPNAIESLVFGELKGYYLVQLEGEKIKEILLEQQANGEEIPHYLGEEVSFLKKNRDLWWVSFDHLTVKERDPHHSVVTLLDSTKKIVGEAAFSWRGGRMTSLKFEKK